jgi:two-component system invasion response regulator UvrY
VIRILIADDHAIVREGLKQILAPRKDLAVTGEAATFDEVLAKTRGQSFDVVVLDLVLGDRSGLELLKLLTAEHPKLPVLILSMHSEEQYAARLLKAGAAGYLMKSSAPHELVDAVVRIAAGGRYVSPAMAERLVFDLTESSGAPHERLSDREFQIFELIASGKSLTEIAGDLNLSVKTVSTHRTRILAKMKLRNNAELIHYAIRHGLLR